MLWLPKWLRSETEAPAIVVPELAVSRRTFLFLGTAAAVGTLLPASPFDPVFSNTETIDKILKDTYLPWVADSLKRVTVLESFVLEDDQTPTQVAAAALFTPRGLDTVMYEAKRRLHARRTL